ncbi:MAG: hypothetical protein HPY66_2370 [Firmicutes bacterium]|nr:hypothetical protein [Bacillota bacterium]
MILGLKIWLGAVVLVTLMYTIRHLLFAFVRLYYPQRHSYQDIAGVYLPTVCIMVPMHNEELVVSQTIRALKKIDYPKDLLKIIIIDDRSTDRTGAILDELCASSPHITVLHRTDRDGSEGGKPAALNHALRFTDAEVILTFDADYWPSRDSVMRLVAPLVDPKVVLTMGRVVPRNPDANFLTRMLDLERAGGYQVNQQTRHTLNLLPQYGGTVGAIRRSFIMTLNGWDASYLAEDTYLTVQAFIHGLSVTYVNLEETTEEVPTTWSVRQKQLRRWVIGHNQVAFRLGAKMLRSPFLSIWQKIDGIFMMFLYGSTMLLATGYVAAIILLLLGDGLFAGASMAVILFTTYSTLGNSAAFIEIAVSAILDSRPRAVLSVPGMIFHFAGSLYVVIYATLDWLWLELRGKRQVQWQKTARTGGE